ncbi:MAG: MFS transporter [Hyphomicrobiales bacterium]
MRGAASLRLFRDPNFRALWVGQLVSIFGDRFTYLALLAVVVAHARTPGNPAAELALLPVVSFLPSILFSPWAGALVDGWNTKRVLVVSDAARGVIVLAMIPATAWGGLPACFALVFLLYFANAFFLPARSAILPDLVPEERLVEANSLATLAGVIATIVGSVAGGVAVERWGWRLGFALDAVTYFVSVAALAAIRAPAKPPRAAASGRTGRRYRALAADVAEGARLAIGSGRVLGAIGAVVLLWMAGGALHVAVPILLERRGAGVVSGVGTILAAAATGMVAGTLLLAARGKGGSSWGRVAWGLAGTGASLAAFALSRSASADLAIAFFAGLFVSILLVTTEASLQEDVATALRGRVFALRDFASRLLVLASAGITGALLARGAAGPAAAVIAGGALLIAGGVALAARARRAVR